MDMDVAVAVDLDPVSRMDDNGHSRILDDRRPLERHAGLELVAVVDRSLVDALQRVIHLPMALERALGLGARRLALAHRELADLGRRDEVDADHLDRRFEAVCVFALVGVVERRLDRSERLFRHPVARYQHLCRMLLVLVAEFSVAQEPDLPGIDPFRGELRARLVLRLREHRLDPVRRAFLQVGQPRHEVVAAQVRHHHAPGREHRGAGRHDHLLHAELGGERHAVHSPAAAEGDEREVARVVAAVERHQLQRVDHVVVGDADDAARRLVGTDAELLAHRRDRLLGGRHVRNDLAAAEIVLVDAPEPEIGVCRRRLVATLAIGGRPGHGACRLRTDMQLAEIVDPGDRAAAIADLDQVDHRHHDRIAGRDAVALDPVIGLDLHLAVLDQRALRRRAADVERNDVLLADQLAELGCAPESGGRAGLHHRDRDLRHRLQRVDAAIRLHDVRAPYEAAFLQPIVQSRQVAFGRRLHIGRQHRRVRALVFAPFPRDLVRGDDRDLRPQFLHLGERRLLVAGVSVRMQEADGDGLHAIPTEIVEDRGQPGEVERLHLDALIRDAAGQLAPQIARHERLRLLVVEVEEIRPVASGDFQRIAKTLRGDQPDLDALAFGQRVDDHGGAVRQEIDRLGIDAALFQHVEHTRLEVRRRRVGFGRDHPLLAGAMIGLEADQVGEGAADVGRHADRLLRHHALPFATSSLSSRQTVPGSLSASEACTRASV
jgi:hypothetical protein